MSSNSGKLIVRVPVACLNTKFGGIISPMERWTASWGEGAKRRKMVGRGDAQLFPRSRNVTPHLNTLWPSLANVMPPYFDFIDRVNLKEPSYLATGSTQTAGYSAPSPPPARQMPSHVVVDPQLPQNIQESLRSYLTTKCGLRPVPDRLVARLDLTQQSLVVNLPNLKNDAAAVFFFVENV
jgi:hypothetical protein